MFAAFSMLKLRARRASSLILFSFSDFRLSPLSSPFSDSERFLTPTIDRPLLSFRPRCAESRTVLVAPARARQCSNGCDKRKPKTTHSFALEQTRALAAEGFPKLKGHINEVTFIFGVQIIRWGRKPRMNNKTGL